jgi:TRAP-type C4-dicarboxylate transport system substrate-binding protein
MAMLCITVFLAATGVLEAAQYRLGAHYPAGYFCNNGFRRMADKIKEATNGEVDIVLYESGALGSYEQVFQEVMRGTVDMVTNYPTSRFNKKFELVGTPSLANGYDELNKLTQRPSPFHKYLESIYDESGVVFIGSFVDTIGGANVRKGKTIEHPYDTSNKQCQMRVVALTAVRKWWAAMGYQLANVPYAEVFTSMQTGVIDGDSGSGPEGAFLSFGDAMGTFIEYPNYFYLLDFVVSKKAWDSFDDKTKQIIIDAFDAEQEVVFKEAKESYDTYLQKIKDAGKTVLSPTPDDIKVMDETAYEHSWPETAKITGPEVLQAIKEYLGK